MGRQSRWLRDLVAKVQAEVKAEQARNRPKPRRMSTQHAREYQRLAQRPYPPEFYAFTCGARTRRGTACKIRSLWFNGRCKFHGGLSTGPKSKQGRRQSALNGRKGGRPRKHVVNQEGKT
jgi:hypothetical protein